MVITPLITQHIHLYKIWIMAGKESLVLSPKRRALVLLLLSGSGSLPQTVELVLGPTGESWAGHGNAEPCLSPPSRSFPFTPPAVKQAKAGAEYKVHL